MNNNPSKLKVNEFFPGMKLSPGSRGIVQNGMGNYATDSFKNNDKISQGASMEKLKEKYFGKTDIKGGPQGNSSSDSNDEIFTDDARSTVATKDEPLDVSLIEPETNNNQDSANNAAVGKKTVISQNGIPKAAQG